MRQAAEEPTGFCFYLFNIVCIIISSVLSREGGWKDLWARKSGTFGAVARAIGICNTDRKLDQKLTVEQKSFDVNVVTLRNINGRINLGAMTYVQWCYLATVIKMFY